MKSKEKPSIKRYQETYSLELQERLQKEGIAFSETKDRTAYVSGLKKILKEGRERIQEIHQSGAGGTEVVYRMTAWADAILMELFNSARILTGLKKEEIRCALLAIGGYGRGELNPFSDLDVMFLTSKKIDHASSEFSKSCLYFMWDLNLDIGHSIRAIPDCVELAMTDIKGKTSLIESRFLAGSREVYDEFVEESRSKILCRGTETYLRTKIADVSERYKKVGGSLYMKEPNIKEGVGGLRDIHTAFWIAKVKFGVNTLGELKEKGVFTEKEDKILGRALEFLWKVRNHLHFISGRRNDSLTMDMQDELAAFFKFKDLKHYLAVERFMRAYYLQTRNIRYFTELLMNRCTPSSRLKKFLRIPLKRERIEKGFSIIGKSLCVPEGQAACFKENPELLMEIFYLSQRHGVPLSDTAKQMVLSSLRLVNDDFRKSERVRDLFLLILGGEKDVVKTLRRMHEVRFLGRYIPEFGALTALVQHEIYHSYTVDEHTLIALEKLEQLRGSHYPRERFYSSLFQKVRKPEILYISLMLHDIGKAMGAGHVKRGGRSIPEIMQRIGLPKEDAGTVEFVVRNHLVLGHLSQRRDIHDPKLIADLAREVRDEERLSMLTLVTYCDINAVGPAIWNDWKDTLLQELFQRTRAYLVSGVERPIEVDRAAYLEEIGKMILEKGETLFGREETERLLKTLPVHYLLATPQSTVITHLSMLRKLDDEGFVVEWNHLSERGYTELNVCTYDSDTPGLFSRIAGVLASRGVNILGARIFTSSKGAVIDCVHVEPPDEVKRGEQRFWSETTDAMRSVVQRTSRVEEMLGARKVPSYMKRKKRRKVPPSVHFDNDVSYKQTVIDVYAEDRIGLLYSITSCLAAQGIHIHSSKITTEAERAIDAFYVTDIFGDKITEKSKQEKIQEALLRALSGGKGE